ncbi:TPA: host cell division inhibitor Icd-like protein [Escherichia coli]|nr:host cell division inhibitor Icd-like protein [Escherichia coli]EEC8436988.1 host cell division inhibitor Icd-like protein [Escherichia coli]EEU4830096.1 host cell division inhibitor Icd-like protein [Escherichia coli]EEY8777966.1 host cell division inhibitor Icd-like protein [Escherichia coli]EEY9152417.1 host cell division inhibitor Icd-like protein [Escherichia coli]
MDERTRTRSARNDRLTYIGQMMNIKKAAPKWSHLSEQLTRCAVCVNNHKPGHDNRDQAGGQLSCLLGPYCAAIFIRSEREYFFRNSSRTKAHGANLSDSCSSAIFSCSLFVFCDGVLVDSLLVIVCSCKAMRRSTSHHGADGFYPLGSMPRRFSSVRPNSLSQLARLTPSLLASLSNCSFSSGDIRIWNGGALPVPFGFLSRLITVDMCTPIALCFYSIGVHLNTRALKKAKPGCARTLTGLLTKPLIEVTIMAIKEHSLLFIHTQTPRKRNNPFHGSVLCTHPGGRFLPDLSRRGYLSTKSSRANFSGGTKRGAGGGIFVLVSSSSSLAQASDCLCRMISSSCVCVSCIGDSVLLVMILPCKAMRRSTSHHGADSDYSDSLALRRWRRLISPSNAAVTNCPVLSPSSLTLSIASTIWSGTRASILFDFAFTDFVAISDFRLVWCPTMITIKKVNAMLDVSHTIKIICVRHFIFISNETTKPRTVGAVTGLLTTNDSESIEVAMRNHTTHPQGRDSHDLNKYIWRFIALSTAQPRVITIEATSEQEARLQSPAGCVMVFAARIRQGSHHA